jgi:hypothetical protein
MTWPELPSAETVVSQRRLRPSPTTPCFGEVTTDALLSPAIDVLEMSCISPVELAGFVGDVGERVSASAVHGELNTKGPQNVLLKTQSMVRAETEGLRRKCVTSFKRPCLLVRVRAMS